MAEKEFPPSADRIAKARRDGQAVKSKILTQALVWWGLLAAFLAVDLPGRLQSLSGIASIQMRPEVIGAAAFRTTFLVLLVILGVPAAVGVGISLFQTGNLFSPKVVVPKLSNVNPLSLFSRMKESACDTGLGLMRVGVLLWVTYPVLSEAFFWEVPQILRLAGAYEVSWEGYSERLIAPVWSLVYRCGGVLVGLGGAAYGLSRWRYMRKLMMSAQEVRDEYKQNEGDPHMKSVRRHEHETLLTSGLAARVKRAKVIVVRRRSE